MTPARGNAPNYLLGIRPLSHLSSPLPSPSLPPPTRTISLSLVQVLSLCVFSLSIHTLLRSDVMCTVHGALKPKRSLRLSLSLSVCVCVGCVCVCVCVWVCVCVGGCVGGWVSLPPPPPFSFFHTFLKWSFYANIHTYAHQSDTEI